MICQNKRAIYKACCDWLNSQLFGEEDPDQDVSPDTEDPELAGEAGETALGHASTEKEAQGGVQRKSTRAWAMECGYDAEKIFNKVTHHMTHHMIHHIIHHMIHHMTSLKSYK